MLHLPHFYIVDDGLSLSISNLMLKDQWKQEEIQASGLRFFRPSNILRTYDARQELAVTVNDSD